jgi:hypothetical protein
VEGAALESSRRCGYESQRQDRTAFAKLVLGYVTPFDLTPSERISGSRSAVAPVADGMIHNVVMMCAQARAAAVHRFFLRNFTTCV